MRRNLFAALAGAIFGLGLLVSGMTDTTRVQGWLDVFGDWDPTLAFVMGGAMIPMVIAWRVAARRRVAVLGTALPLTQERTVDAKLVMGSSLFGAGWGLAGLCPGRGYGRSARRKGAHRPDHAGGLTRPPTRRRGRWTSAP